MPTLTCRHRAFDQRPMGLRRPRTQFEETQRIVPRRIVGPMTSVDQDLAEPAQVHPVCTGIRSTATADDVTVRPTLEVVGTWAAPDHVPARMAVHGVVVGATPHDVVALARPDGVVAGAGPHSIVTAVAVNPVVAGSRADEVVTVTAEDDVVSTRIDDHVASGGSLEPVIPETTEDRSGPAAAGGDGRSAPVAVGSRHSERPRWVVAPLVLHRELAVDLDQDLGSGRPPGDEDTSQTDQVDFIVVRVDRE